MATDPVRAHLLEHLRAFLALTANLECRVAGSDALAPITVAKLLVLFDDLSRQALTALTPLFPPLPPGALPGPAQADTMPPIPKPSQN